MWSGVEQVGRVGRGKVFMGKMESSLGSEREGVLVPYVQFSRACD